MEGRRQASIPKHEHVVGISEYGELPKGNPYLAMEYVEGTTLAKCRKRFGRDEAESMIMEIVEGIVHANEHGVRIHGDIKPENILIDKQGFCHVADFGLALGKADSDESTELIGGTLRYAAPEKIRRWRGEDEDVGPESDVWSLGLLYYELLTGRCLFKGKPKSIERAIVSAGPYELSGIDMREARIIGRCLDSYGCFPRYRAPANLLYDLRSKGKVKCCDVENRCESFIGRDAEFSQLREELMNRNAVSITGPIGIGKTEFVREYVYRHASEYSVVAWLDLKRLKTHRDLAWRFKVQMWRSCFKLLEGDEPGFGIEGDIDDWLQAPESLLIVFDGADSLRPIARFIDLNVYAHIIITSRDFLFDLNEPTFGEIRLGALTPSQYSKVLSNNSYRSRFAIGLDEQQNLPVPRKRDTGLLWVVKRGDDY